MHVITVVYQYFDPSKMIPHPKLDLRVFSKNTKQAERSSHHLLCLLLDVC